MRVRAVECFNGYCMNMHFINEDRVERIFLIGTIVSINFSDVKLNKYVNLYRDNNPSKVFRNKNQCQNNENSRGLKI